MKQANSQRPVDTCVWNPKVQRIIVIQYIIDDYTITRFSQENGLLIFKKVATERSQVNSMIISS